MANSSIDETVAAWQEYISTIDDWQALTEHTEPKYGGCGFVYELPNPIERPKESFAIADMRQLKTSEPHKHMNGETEIYIVLTGHGKTAVGDTLFNLVPGMVVVIPPEAPHCTLPGDDLVLAVVNTPPFNAANYVTLDESDPAATRMLLKLRT